MIELSEGTMSVATLGNATSRDCGTSVFECWRRRSNHERHGAERRTDPREPPPGGRALLLCLLCAEAGWLVLVNAWLRLERAYLKLRLFLRV